MIKLDLNSKDILNRCSYQDYLIKDGIYIGLFEDMYRDSSEVPWHQD